MYQMEKMVQRKISPNHVKYMCTERQMRSSNNETL